MPPAAPVTPAGVRDGDPAALIGLCTARGPSVLAYCRHVAGDAEAGDAAAAAFARFRLAVVATPDLAGLDPEPLLISATRTAAARHAARGAQGVCAEVPALLAARADKSISLRDLERLEQHLEGCWACRAPVARFKAAERAYGDPHEPAIDPAIAAQIFVALATVAPSPARQQAPPPPAVPTAPANGSARRHAGAAVLPAADTADAQAVDAVDVADAQEADTVDVADAQEADTAGVADAQAVDTAGAADAQAVDTAGVADAQAVDALDQPTAEFRTPDVLDPDPATARPAPPEEHEPPRRDGVVGSLLGSFGLGSSHTDLQLPPRVDVPEPEAETILETRPARDRRRARGAAAGARRPARRQPARRRRGGVRRPRRLPLVLPLVLVLIALVAALFVSGVVGGSDPASSPRVAAPADASSDGSAADVVVVPGAEPASGDAVEDAKARERARERAQARRRRQAAADRETVRTTRAEPSAPIAPPAAATPPPPPPPAAATAPATRTSGTGRKIDAGSGATGAEQIPPAEDSSTVPDLAPPPEPATTP